MICLTGDVHHTAMDSVDLQYCGGTEIDAALKMAEIAASYNLKLTLFFTGLCAREAPESLQKIASMKYVEVGGHNYFAFRPKRLFFLSQKIFGLANGPYWFQFWEVKKTLKTLEAVCKFPIISWRNHGYRHDRNTRIILRENNVRYFSDTLSADFAQPVWNDGVIDVPINTLPDHDYVYHGQRQPGTFDESVLLETAFKTKAMNRNDWLERIKREVSYIENMGGIATILAHPACMEVFDNFTTFENLCSFLSQFQSCNVRDIENLIGVRKV
jgi:hypothetical protein